MTPANLWMKEQPGYKSTDSPFIKNFEFKEVLCAGIITAVKLGDTIFEKLAIRPLSALDNIGIGCGQAIHKEFKYSTMTKAIVSSKLLNKELSAITFAETFDVVFNREEKKLKIGEIEIDCECLSDGKHKVVYGSVNRLLHVTAILDDQPITIAADESQWLYIKEAIL